MLMLTKVTLQLLSNINILSFVAREQCCSISFIGHRHAVANYPHLKHYDPSKPLSFRQLLDTNNLMGGRRVSRYLTEESDS